MILIVVNDIGSLNLDYLTRILHQAEKQTRKTRCQETFQHHLRELIRNSCVSYILIQHGCFCVYKELLCLPKTIFVKFWLNLYNFGKL